MSLAVSSGAPDVRNFNGDGEKQVNLVCFFRKHDRNCIKFKRFPMGIVCSDLGTGRLVAPCGQEKLELEVMTRGPNVSQAQYELTSNGEHCQLGR